MKPSLKPQFSRGFALVVSISLMILLTIIAVGLLTLSATALRSSGQGEAMATARNNARLGLMMAIGDLQATLGPDRAVTATSGLLSSNPTKPNLAGAWESWNFNPSESSPDYTGEKEKRFRRWLVSTPDPVAAQSRDFATAEWSGKTVELVGDNALGGNAASSDKVRAGLVPVSKSGKSPGAFAWHVSDESVKARINLYRNPGLNDTLARKRTLLAGHRHGTAVVKSPKNQLLDFLPSDEDAAAFDKADASSAKVLGLGQVDLVGGKEKIKPFRNDVTPYSLGVLADARNGGLKKDLSSVFEFVGSTTSTTLPAEFNNNRLYQSGIGLTGVSDPYWSSLSGYYNSFRSVTSPEANPTYNQRPTENIPITNLNPGRRFFAGPVIAKVEMLFNYVTRDSHSNWVASLKAVSPDMVYMGHFVYTPLVTLHNPYNVTVSFDSMYVTIRNVPIAFRTFINGVPQSSRLVPLTDMFVNAGDRREKSFVLNIGNWASPTASSTSGPIVLKPGQTLVCGPYLDPGASFSNSKGTPFFDYQNNLTGFDRNDPNSINLAIKAKPGFVGRCVGFDIDWLTPTHGDFNQPPAVQNDGNKGIMGLKARDAFYFEYAIKQPSVGQNDRFQVGAKIVSQGRTYDYGGLEFIYSDSRTLEKFFNKVHRYPANGALTQGQSYVPNTEPVSAHARAHSFAIFSAYARTTSGGVYETGLRTETAGALNVLRDGRLAGKPFLFHNPARAITSINLSREKPGGHSHELNFQPLPGHVDDILEVEGADPSRSTLAANRTPAITGNTTLRGIKSGSYLEIPTGPMLTIADFRRSNALTSSYLPNFVQPVANSTVSPLMSTDKVVQTDTAIATYALLDHSVLANHALYDRFYFSTFATDGSTTPEAAFESFMEGDRPLPMQSFQPYLPSGSEIKKVRSELFSGGKPLTDTYQRAAEYQLLRGPFNVNSTSVQAWKAALAALQRNEIVTLWARSGKVENRKSSNVPILAMSLMNGGLVGTGGAANDIDNARTNEWNGYRELTDTELETLATEIVEQVRTRGPFLSLSEFVNRRIGSESDLTRTGALEAALREAGTNEKVFGTQVPIKSIDIADPNFYGFRTPEVVTGNPAAGAPGWITQGDLMRVLEPGATVRSDTFVVRTCGEAHDARGTVTARVFAEAVVQRIPEYVDPADRPSVNVYTATSAAEANKKFGRRFSVVSFRWLSPEEI